MFGKLHRSRKLDLTCPHCGHIQQESAKAVSSFCRSCGEYFRIRRGVAEAGPGLRVSGIADPLPPRRRTPLTTPDTGAAAGDDEAWQVSAEENEPVPRPLLRPEPEVSEPTGISAGAFFGFADDSGEPEEAVPIPGIGREAQGRESLGQGSMANLMASQQTIVVAEKERMPPNYVAPDGRRRRDDPVAAVPVRCYRCYHIQDVSRYAKSTQCERCSAYISLADYEIKTVKSHTLRTRGDIVIGRRGGLVKNSEIACRHLTVNGAIDATVDCSGDATFRHSGTVRGQLFCEKLTIEKHCEVRFPDGVMARRAEIAGHLVGNLTCSGKVRLARSGLVEGNLSAVDLELKDGGKVTGETRLDPSTSTELPLRKGFNPSVIG